MNNQDIDIQRKKIRQMRKLITKAEPHERSYIHGLLVKNQIKLALLVLQRSLERRAFMVGFDPSTSRRLDAIEILLED